ncbi:MAG: nitrogen regulation protein NR(II) [Gammaproteobacteria bacterium]
MAVTTEKKAALVDSLNTAVVELDNQLKLKYLNPAAENLLAVSKQQVSGTYWPDVIQVGNGLKQRLTTALSEQCPYTEHELEILIDGVKKTVDCTVSPLSSTEIMIEMVQVDQKLRISREEQLMIQQQAARDLLRGLAHEIKNPLGGLRGAAQLLERELEEDELKEYTQVIIGEADRLRNLVDRMLGPKSVPRKQDTNIHEVLERVCSLIAAESDIELQLVREYDPSIPSLLADPELLVQAVLNIVQNAAQIGASEVIIKTHVQRQLTIGHNHYKLVAQIDIIDNGPGIEVGMIEKIFYPMVTGRAEGTGLGLSIAQSLVNEHGGLIECTSEPGNTVFTILLPLERAND